MVPCGVADARRFAIHYVVVSYLILQSNLDLGHRRTILWAF